MLNEERIKLMTKMASYEAKEGKKTIPIGKYYRSDYISYQMIKTGIGLTVAYIMMAGLWILARFEYFMENLHKIDLVGLGKNAAIIYIVFLISYMVIAYNIYYLRYEKSIKSLKKYNSRLKKLKVLYENEQTASDDEKSPGGVLEDDDFIGN